MHVLSSSQPKTDLARRLAPMTSSAMALAWVSACGQREVDNTGVVARRFGDIEAEA
jgi:hypothetical protein